MHVNNYQIGLPLWLVLLVVCSEGDISSRNMRDYLLRKKEWISIDNNVQSDDFPDVRVCSDMALISVPKIHIFTDDVDLIAEKATGLKFSKVVFLSKHKAVSKIPTLTIHPIGNFGKADYGGKDSTLVPSAPGLMTQVLRNMGKLGATIPFRTSYEVTHHGPWLNTPSLFLEVGSDESQWGNLEAAAVLSDSLLQADVSDYPCAIGVGGGHYAPQFTETALSKKISFGHMVPNYALQGLNEEEIIKRIMMAATASSTHLAYIHKKSMKRSEASKLQDLMESAGLEIISSKDLDVL